MTFECRPVQTTFAKALSTMSEQGTGAMLVAVHTLGEHRHKNKTLHDGAGTSNDGIGQFQQTYFT